jgi:hypothetical protein
MLQAAEHPSRLSAQNQDHAANAHLQARLDQWGQCRTDTFSIYLNNAMLTAFETACEEGRNNSQSMPRSSPESAQRCAEAAGLDGGDRDRSTIKDAGTDGLPPTAMPRGQVRGSLHHIRRRVAISDEISLQPHQRGVLTDPG